jgi:hypothetical protein
MDGSVIVVPAVKRNALDRMTESMPPSSSKAGKPGYRCRWDTVTVDVVGEWERDHLPRLASRDEVDRACGRRHAPALRSRL